MPNFRSLPSFVALTALLFQACDLADSTGPLPMTGDTPKTVSDSATQAGKILPPPRTDTTRSDTVILSVPKDTAGAVPADTATRVPTDTLKPVPVDTLKPVPVDTLKPAPVDTLKPVPVDTLKPVPVDTLKPVPVDTLKPAIPPLGPVSLQSDLEDQTASCWSNRDANGYSRTRCGSWGQIGSWGARLAEGRAHSGSKALSVTFAANEEVAGASLPVSADKVNVRAYYMFDAGFDFGQGVKVGRISSFNEAMQMNDIDIILTVRSSGSANQCGLTDMADLSLLFNGRPVGYDWGNISGAVRFVRDRWYAVEYEVKLNRPGARDGSVKLWVDGRLVASKEGINIRGTGGEGVKLNRLRMGGWYSNGANGNSCRNPSQPSTLFIDDVAVGSEYIGT